MVTYPRGSEWRRWDLHVHTPETLLNNQYQDNNWDEFIKNINESSVHVIGITDYMLLDNYKKLYSRRNEIDSQKYILPNLEFRISPETKDGKGINLHLLINPDSDEHIEKIEEALSHLYEDFRGQKYYCTNSHLTKLGNGDLGKGVNLFKISITTFKNWYKEENWLKNNSIVAVANSNYDGVSGLKDSGFLEQRKDFYYFADAIFSSNPKDVSFFMGKGVDPKATVIKEYRSLKPCIHGSDAHCFEKMFKPDNNRYCWIKADPNFVGLKQAILEPERVFIGDIPPTLDRVTKNKTKILEKLNITYVDEYTGSQGEWFNNISIEFNPEMTAIIGNKGSGKTAIAEITALLCNSRKEEDFVFLHRDKFRKKKLASNFKAKLSWSDGTLTNEKNIGTSVDLNQEELVHFVPQRSFEKYCNDSDKDFIAEINNVVFSRMSTEAKLGFSNFEDLKNHRKKEINAKKLELSISIQSLNSEIKKLEEKNDINYKKSIESSLKQKNLELTEHNKIKPKEVLPPADLNTPDYQKLVADKASFDEEIQRIEESKLKTLKKITNLEIIGEAISNLEVSIAEKIAKLRPQLDEYNIELGSLFSYKINKSILSSKLKEFKDDLEKIDKKLKKTENIEECGELIKKVNTIKAKIDEFNKTNQGRLTEYQKYLQEKEIWDAKQKVLTEQKNQLEQSLNYIGDFKSSELLNDIKKKRKERLEITKKIFECLQDEVKIHADFKREIVSFIENYRESMKNYSVSIDSGIFVENEFIKTFVDNYISSNVSSPFKGIEGTKKIKEILDMCNAENWECVASVLDEIQKEFDTANSDNKCFHNILKKDKYNELFNCLYNLDFLQARYSLRLYGKSLEELSPGERGSLLLVFYLLLDARDIPLILDQPEDNLDNESVANILVPFIREAKKRRQIVIITHNANLAVVSDAEQIIRVKIDKQNNNKFSFVSGSLESNIVNDVIDVLEGTRQSFNKRHDKYDITEK